MLAICVTIQVHEGGGEQGGLFLNFFSRKNKGDD